MTTRILFTLTVFLCASLVACGANKSTATSDVVNNNPLYNGKGAVGTETLDQAQSQVQFKILLPHNLPRNVSLQYVNVASGMPSVLHSSGNSVEMNFRDNNSGFVLVEQQGQMGHLESNSVSHVNVDGTDAEYSLINNQHESVLLWHIGNVVCRLTYDHKDPNVGSEKELKNIANSVK